MSKKQYDMIAEVAWTMAYKNTHVLLSQFKMCVSCIAPFK